MKDIYKTKVYGLLEGIHSRAQMLEKGIKGTQKVDPTTALRLLQEIQKLHSDVKDMVDIS
tara:strand:- start:35 stop:214 length:180 start_codon:yes stop_codon:yes gene_type:complete